MPSIYVNYNPLRDINDAQHYPAKVGDTPQAFYESLPDLHELQVICVINREPVLRVDWGRPLGAHDVVLFVARPKGSSGGGGSNPMKLILTLAVLSFAGWAVGAMGLTGAMAGMVKMGIVMAGSQLINQILPTPQPPEPAKQPEPSPTYSLRGQTNTPRLGQPIPVHLGRHICYPDMIMQPYYEYEGDEQYYHMLCCLGVGKIVPERWQFGDIDFASLAAGVAQYQVAYPGQSITLLPAVVYSASISGAELANTWSSSAFANPPATTVTKIGLDFAFAGLVRIGDDGGYNTTSVTVQVQARAVDDAGTALGAWATILTKTYTNNTVDTLRDTVKADVTSGRYEVQVRVSAPPSGDSHTRDKCTWGGLRGYGMAHPNYGDVTIVAVKLKATELLSQQSTQQLNIVATRHLRIWDGTWSALVPSRSIVWGLADLYLNSSMGRQAENTLLLSELRTLHTKLESLNHHFDYRFDQSGTKLLDSMQIAARAGRCALFNQFGYWRLTRDDARTAPVQMFTGDNIKDFALDITMPQAGEPDGIVGKFMRSDTWQADTVTVPRAGVTTPVNPETVDLTGITDRGHAWDEITYMARAEARRESGYLVTGMEGRIPVINDLIAISPDGVDWGEYGSVLAMAGSTLTLSDPPELAAGKIMLRGKDGKPLGNTTYNFTRTTTDAITVTGLPAGVQVGSTFEPTYYILGAANTDIVYGRVKSCKRADGDYMRIDFVVEDSSVYATVGTPPVDTRPPLTGSGAQLNVAWLKVTERADGDQFRLTLTWSNVAAANQYALEVSPNGTGWTRIYTGSNARFEYSTKTGNLYFRVAAINGVRGEWYALTYAVGSGGNVSPPPAGLGLQVAFTGAVCRIAWQLVAGIPKYRLKVFDTVTMAEKRSVDIAGATYDYSYLMAQQDGCSRHLTFRLWSLDAAGNQSATFSQLQVNNPQVGALQNVSAIGFQGQIMIEYDWPSAHPDAAGVLVFMSETSGFTPSSANQVYEGADTVIGIPATTNTTKYIKVAGFDYWGTDQLTYSAQLTATAGKFNPFDIVDGLEPIPIVNPLPPPATWTGKTTVSYQGRLLHLVGGVWTPYVVDTGTIVGHITSTQIADNSISTPKLMANAVTAYNIAANSITSDKIVANSIISAQIQAGAVSADKIAANSIGTDKLIANSVTADKMYVASLGAITANLGVITAGYIQNASGYFMMNLNATGAQNVIYTQNSTGQSVFAVNGNGDLYLRGNIEATSIKAGSLVVDTAMIGGDAVTSLNGDHNYNQVGFTTSATLMSVSYNARGGKNLIFWKARGDRFPGSVVSGGGGSRYQTPVTMTFGLFFNGNLVDSETITMTAPTPSSMTPNAAGVWGSVRGFWSSPALWGWCTVEIRVWQSGGSTIGASGYSNEQFIQIFQAVR